MRKIPQDIIIKRFVDIHGDRYDYSLVEYINSKTKVKIICKLHGVFKQLPYSHSKGSNCPLCVGNIKKSTNKFIKDAKLVHGNKYQYTSYKNSNTKVDIICKIHGVFKQTPNSHLSGSGCPLCSVNYKLTTKDFISNAEEIHGKLYDYSLVNYINNYTPITIICGIHGEFTQIPNNHTSKRQGCPGCVNRRLSTSEFISKSKLVHSNRYDYSLVEYINNKTKVKIVCKLHGEFKQLPMNHLNGHNCFKCSGNSTKTTKEFVNESKLIHSNRYDYSLVNYVNNISNVSIICKLHGEFKQRPTSHLNGSGCPGCNNSSGEDRIYNILKDIGISFNVEYSFDDCVYKHPLKFDFYLYEKNICIEYDGIHHFEPIEYFGGTSVYKETIIRDRIKNDYCEDNNIKLIRIPYWDFDDIEKIIIKEVI